MSEDQPLGLMLKRPPRFDPFPTPEVEPPLVLRLRSDTPEMRRMAAALEAATAKALDSWLRLGRLP
jgi:hypothetical protein